MPEWGSVKRIVTGQAAPSDALLLLYFLHLKAPAKTTPPPEEKAPTEKTKEGEANKGEEPVAKTQEKPAPNEEPAKPGQDGKAYEKGKKQKTTGQPEDQLSTKGRDVPPLTEAELARVLEWQNFRNKFLKEWRGKDFSSYDSALKSKLRKVRNSIIKNTTPDDLAATIKENRGEQILDADGNPYNHIQENKQASTSISNAIDELKTQMGKDPANYSEYESMLRDLSKLKDNMNTTIKP